MSAFGKTSGGKASDMLGAMRASAEGALKRLAGGGPAPRKSPEAPEGFAPLDPTRAFMPDEESKEESARSAPLSTLLEESAHAMVRRTEDLHGLARRLALRIEERRNGEITMAAQGLRVVIGLVWLGASVWLYNAILTARADDLAVIPGGAPLSDAAVLMRTFFLVAAAGLGVAFGTAALARALGNADNGRVRREAERLGAAVAETAGEFDRTLSALRRAMDQRSRPADAVDDLSRAHLTALEAHAFFREIGFLTGEDDDQSLRLFNGFLGRAAGRESGGVLAASLLSFIAGGALGALGVYAAIAPEPEIIETAPEAALAIMQYPWAAYLLILGGAFYAAAGAFLSFFAGPLTSDIAAKAREDALTALRSGFAAHSAMGPADVTRRIKDAVDVFRARVGGGGGARAGLSGSRTEDASANHAGAFSTEDDVPEWRRRDSSVKFVSTGFSAAPSGFRTDAFAKKFSGDKAGETGSKRGGEGLKNRARD